MAEGELSSDSSLMAEDSEAVPLWLDPAQMKDKALRVRIVIRQRWLGSKEV